MEGQSTVVKEGWLAREGQQGNWRQRWVRLVRKGPRTKLSWHRSEKETNPLGVVRLKGAIVHRHEDKKGSEKHCFAVYTNPKPLQQSSVQSTHVFYFGVDKEEDLLAWMGAIEDAIKSCSETVQTAHTIWRTHAPSPALKPRRKIKKSEESGPDWEQDNDSVTVSFDVEPGCSVNDLELSFMNKWIDISFKNAAKPLCVGALGGSIRPNDCLVRIDHGRCIISMPKLTPGTKWASLFLTIEGQAQGGAKGRTKPGTQAVTDHDDWSEESESEDAAAPVPRGPSVPAVVKTRNSAHRRSKRRSGVMASPNKTAPAEGTMPTAQ